MPNFLAIAGAFASVALVAAAGTVWKGVEGSSPYDVALPLYCEQDPSPAACRQVQQALADGEPQDAVEAVMQGMRQDPEVVDNCHGLLHYIGSRFAERLAEQQDDWKASFPTCGYGLLHGVYERLPLPSDMEQVPEYLRDACSMEATDLDGACAHALGHDLVAHWPGQVRNTTHICAGSFSAEPARSQLKVASCQVGVLMEEAQRKIRSTPANTSSAITLEWLSNLASMCSEVRELEKWCPGSFVSAVSQLDSRAVQTYLAWCAYEYPQGARSCATWAGEHLGMRNDLGPELLSGCSGVYILECKAAIFDGARSVSTRGQQDSDTRVCTLLEQAGDVDAQELCSLAARHANMPVSIGLERQQAGSG